MTKQYPIILLNNEMYMIGELAKYNGTRQNIFCLAHPNDFGGLRIGADTGFCELCHVVLASSDKTLNLPLLPAIEENYQQLAEKAFPKWRFLRSDDWNNLSDGFIEGYKANTKKWSDEDIRNCFLAAREFNSLDGVVDVDVVLNFKGADNSDLQALWTTPEEYLKSLQPKPKFVWIEVENDIPLLENGYVKVNKWNY